MINFIAGPNRVSLIRHCACFHSWQLSSGRRDGQTTVGVVFKTQNMQIYLPFSDVAHDKRNITSDVGNGQFIFGGDPIGLYGDIRARAETGSRRVPSAGNCVISR